MNIILVCAALALTGHEAEASSEKSVSADITSNLIAHYEFENAGKPGLDTMGTYPGSGPSVVGDAKRGNVGDVTNAGGLAVPAIPTGSDYTIAMWYKNPNKSSWGSFATAGNDGQDVILLYRNSWNLGCYHGARFKNSGYNISGTQEQWFHLALVVTSGSGQFYIDGSPVGSTFSAVGQEITNFGDFTQTGAGNACEFLDDIRVYSVAKTAKEIAEIYNLPPSLGQVTNEKPDDKETGVTINAVLSWTPHVKAEKHDVYFGTTFDDVNDASNLNPMGPDKVYRARQDANSYTVAETLVFGKTYYWRIDEVNAAEDPNKVKGNVWQFTTHKQTASNPNLQDGATDVRREVVLRWTPGIKAEKHDVYYGTNFDDVNDATTTVNPKNVYKGRQDADRYPVAETLVYGETYYWRVDEVNMGEKPSMYKGDVWKFTISPPPVYQIPSYRITAVTASSRDTKDNLPDETIDSSELDGDLHSANASHMWLSGDESPGDAWIQYEFDSIHELNEMWVWNHNENTKFGFKTVTVEYSADGKAWTKLSGVPEFTEAPGTANYAHNTTVDFGGVSAKYVKLTCSRNWDDTLNDSDNYGLSEVRFFAVGEESLIESGPEADIISKYKGVFEGPPRRVPASGHVDGPLLGNGDVGVVLSGAPEAQRFWISKCDFWKAGGGGKGPRAIGGLDLRIPALAGAAYHAEQILYEAEVRGTFRTADGSVAIRSWVPASENLLVIELTSKGKAVTAEAIPWIKTGDGSKTAQGTTNDVQWVTRAFTAAGRVWPAEAALAARCLKADLKSFTLEPGRPVTIVMAIRSNYDAKSYLDNARNRALELTSGEVEALRRTHINWWRNFWSESYVEIGDPLLEKFYYGSHYIIASCSRNKKFAAAMYGNWTTNDRPSWTGDYHLNYNYQAPWWGCYSSNHIELTEPYDTPLLEFMPRGKFYAKRERLPSGIQYPIGIGPKGLEVFPIFLGQNYMAAYGAVNMSMRFYHTYDLDYARKIYPYLIEVANFWEKHLEFANGRYAIVNDCLNETKKKPDDVNPPNCMGVVMLAFKTIIDMSIELDVDADRRKKWQHILDHFSDFPTYQYKGKTVFNGAEKGQSANGGELGWPIIEHIWPDGQIGLDSDPKLLEVAHNTIRLKPTWVHANCFPMTYTAAARVGYDPNVILKNLRKRCDSGWPNHWINQRGGGIETASAVPSSINEMLLQSHEKVLRFFPVWPKDKDARFGTLRAVGAFLVSSALKDGRVRHVTIVSEKGRDCTVQNPWPGKAVTLSRNGKKAETLKGNRFTFKTRRGERIALVPNE